MRRLPTLLTILTTGAIALAGCGGDDPVAEPTPTGEETTATATTEATETAEPTPTAPTTAATPAYQETLTLTGAAVPDGGSEDGSGVATLTLNPDAGEVCFEVTVEGVPSVNAMHIHQGEAGADGPVFIGLEAPGESGEVDDCVQAETAKIQQIVDSPAAFYLNLHNADHPDGVLRSQLG